MTQMKTSEMVQQLFKTRTLQYEALSLSDYVQRSSEGKLTRPPTEEYPNEQA